MTNLWWHTTTKFCDQKNESPSVLGSFYVIFIKHLQNFYKTLECTFIHSLLTCLFLADLYDFPNCPFECFVNNENFIHWVKMLDFYFACRKSFWSNVVHFQFVSWKRLFSALAICVFLYTKCWTHLLRDEFLEKLQVRINFRHFTSNFYFPACCVEFCWKKILFEKKLALIL